MGNKRTVYHGAATITGCGLEDLTEKQKAKLNEADRANAFTLVYICSTPDKGDFEVRLEVSHRELSGKQLEIYAQRLDHTPTRMDVTLSDLVKQGFLQRGATEANLPEAVSDAVIGKRVNINVIEDERQDVPGEYWPPRAYFTTGKALLTGDALQSRMAAFMSGKPMTAAPATVIPAPEEEDSDPGDIPF